MHANHLGRLLRRVAAGALPLTAAGLLGPLSAGCISDPLIRTEVKEVEAFPEGWSLSDDGFHLEETKGGWYFGGPDDPDISLGECGILCGPMRDLRGCQLAVQCTGSSDGFGCDPLTSPDDGVQPGTLTFFALCQVAYSQASGRRPEGLAERRQFASENAVGAYFADMAHLEAASVDAFDILGAELAAHGAPRSLRRAARHAARDEVRHARVMARFARRAGARATRPVVRRPPSPRSLLDIALENATEGCVRETYGALVAHWQAARAEEPQVRAAFAMVARDEARHAALSWRVASWAHSRLSAAERKTVAAARARTAAELLAELRREPPPELAPLGLPSAETAVALFSDLARALDLAPSA